MENKLDRLEEFNEQTGVNISEEMIEKLVELVGSEEEVEEAAKSAHDELLAASEAGEVEYSEESVPEKLAVAALIVKLVELGKLGPEDADQFIQEHLD